jgi:hypothetical protein
MKYELTKNFIEYKGRKLYQIKALKDFWKVEVGDLGGYIWKVEVGDLGGYIEKESNLSQEGDCWVCDEAKVFGDAEVYGNAKIRDIAEVYGNAKIYGNVMVSDYAVINGSDKIGGDLFIYN